MFHTFIIRRTSVDGAERKTRVLRIINLRNINTESYFEFLKNTVLNCINFKNCDHKVLRLDL